MAISLSHEALVLEAKANGWRNTEEYINFKIQYLRETIHDRIYFTKQGEHEVLYDPIDHPEFYQYEVWVEGYAATEDHASAELLGKVRARNFAQACDLVMMKIHQDSILVSLIDSRSQRPRKWDYDPNRLTYWGCRLFWNEELARKAFG